VKILPTLQKSKICDLDKIRAMPYRIGVFRVCKVDSLRFYAVYKALYNTAGRMREVWEVTHRAEATPSHCLALRT